MHTIHRERGLALALGEVTPAKNVWVLLLGQFEVWVEKRRLVVPRSAARLVAFLALQERAVSRVAVAGALWPDMSPDKSQASLRTACWRARQACQEVVCTRGDSLQLDSVVHSDVGVLREVARSPDGALEANWADCPAVSARELLPEWQEDWVIAEREYYRVMSLQNLERLSAWHRDRGNYHASAHAALAALHLEPMRESAHRALIAIDLDQGNMAEALRHFNAYRILLYRELALSPSRQMQDLLLSAGLATQGCDTAGL